MSLSRRGFLIGTAGLSAFFLGASATRAAPRPDGKVITPAQALERLQRGNTRYVHGNSIERTYAPHGTSAESGQWPFAAIVSCSDSRVVPEIAFDIAPKNLFIIRNAGNLVDDVTLGSLEYATVHLGISLILVLGHGHCGAVNATETALRTGVMPDPHVNSIVDLIIPGVQGLPAGHSLDDAIAANARWQASSIQAMSPIIAQRTAAGTVGIASAVYGLASRRVQFLP